MVRTAALVLVIVCGITIGCGGGSSSLSSGTPPTSPGTTDQNGVPTVTAISPASTTAGVVPVAITVSGTDFVSGATVQWNKTALATTFKSSTVLSAELPASDVQSGSVDAITVENPAPGGGTSGSIAFNVNNPKPVVSSISPATVTAGSAALTLMVTGTGFVPGAVVNWGSAALSTQFVSAIELKAVLPASDVSGSAAEMVTVTNPGPGGGTTAASTVTVESPLPSISSISPQTVPTGVAAIITVNGSGFESNSVVLWNGSPRKTTFVNSTTLQVALSATDLQQSTTGALSVSNPGPDGSTSSVASLAVTSQPIPTITAATIVSISFGSCPQFQVTLTGTNFTSASSIQANGMTVGQSQFEGGITSISTLLPSGFVSQAGALSFTVTNPGVPPATSAPFSYPATNPPMLGICPLPSPATVFPSSTFTVDVQPTEVNATGTAQVSVGALPSGLTVSNATVPLPATGGLLHFQAAASLAAATDTLTFSATAGVAKANATYTLNVSSGAAPSFGFTQPSPGEVAVPIGGSGSTQLTSFADGLNLLFDITPTVTGLPAGTTATVVPAVTSPGQVFTVTLNAASGAPITQNGTVTVTGKSSAGGTTATASFLADVTQPPGSLPDSRSDFTSTGGTPYGGVYDKVHNLIFASDPSWNRIEVLSNETHKVTKRVDIPFPQGIDISQDGSTVWLGTQSQQIYAINTTTLATTRYVAPPYQSNPWMTYQLVALSDGTLLLTIGPGVGYGTGTYAIWDPRTNALTTANINLGGGITTGPLLRSGDGTKAYTYSADSANCSLVIYNVASQASAASMLNEACSFFAVNNDGTRLVAENNAVVGLYDGSMNLIGPLPLTEPNAPYYFAGSFIFSNDGNTLYELANQRIATIDAQSLKLVGLAPTLDAQDQSVTNQNTASAPFGVDTNGIVLDTQVSGVGFEDTTFFQNYGSNMVPPEPAGSLSVYSGPLSGGTQISPYGYFSTTPDVWFNGTRGLAQINGNTLTVTSPASNAPGPVNLKFIFPDGNQVFAPLDYSYSATPEFAINSGASPVGGAPGSITGWGMPIDSSGGSVTVGGNTAIITSQATQYLPFTLEPFPTTYLNFTIPGGSPGWADISVTTPGGTGTLPRALYYAKSVSDYASQDMLTSVLYDASRSQVYLTATDHVDVFSLSSSQFGPPLDPPAVGKSKQFTGLALTPDSSKLLVTDLQDGSLAVISPDTPANSFVIPIAPEYSPYNNCSDGPIYVAASADQKAFVVTGSLPAPSCPAQGNLYVADLVTKTAGRPSTAPSACGFGIYSPPFADATSTGASSDGNLVVIGGLNNVPACLYSAQTGQFQDLPLGGLSNQISGDGNALAGYSGLGASGGSDVFGDIHGNRINALAQPLPVYPSLTGLNVPVPLYQPVLNASGSLQYIAYPNFFEIIDVLHGRLLIRFSLAETVQNTASPIAIDSGGRYVFLITTTGLTVVDLGEAPLAIGHLSQVSGSAGSQIVVRGSGFDSSTVATVAGHAASVSITDENTLTLTIPSAPAGPDDLILSRADGSVYTLESGVIVQ